MNRPIITARDLGKVFHIGSHAAPYRTLRESVTAAATAPLRRAGRLLRGHASGAAGLTRPMWALRDVSFEIAPGEVVGIIGRNGAGKSTLLKILSRISQPTRGYVDLCGSVGSLLEVGTGFHPELTGRENVFLNGAILGMSRKDISMRFDEIVDFAEVEQFIDTPVKHYSSGMAMRLAFAVAAHLEPDILIMDEVLAVGDATFQKKCLAKMEAVGQHGRTVLFVSHNMPAVTRLCSRSILLDRGRVVADGPSHQVVSTYLNSGLGTTAERVWNNPEEAPRGQNSRLRAVRVSTPGGHPVDAIDIRSDIHIEMEYDVLKEGMLLMPHYHLFNEDGVHLFPTMGFESGWRGRPRPPGRYTSRVTIPGNLFAEGTVFVNACLCGLEPFIVEFTARDAVAFQVVDTVEGNSARGDWVMDMPGVVRPLLKWETWLDRAGERASDADACLAATEVGR